MLATEESVSILDVADELSKMILSSDIVTDYYQCLYSLRSDQKAMSLIKEFSKQKEQYEEVHRIGKHHPDYLTVITKTRELKRDLDLQETVYAFKQAENALQLLLDEVSVKIGQAVSKQIKVPTGDPFFAEESSCNSGCSSGNGCSCN